MKFLVCDTDNESCMLRECSEHLRLETLLKVWVNEIDNLREEIAFKQWVKTDSKELITQILPNDEFLHSLVEKFLVLKCHHFISKVQSQNFKM